ncbi:hypothetical protein ACKWTF_014073 [Chironomus riparius]
MASSVHSIISTLHYLAKFFGIYLFTLNSLTLHPEFKISDLICGSVAIIFYGIISYIHWMHAFVYIKINSRIVEKGIPIMMTLHYFLYTTIIMLSNIKRKDFGEICKNLTEVDKSFEYFDTKFDYKKISGTVRIAVIKLMTWITALVLLGAVLAYKFDDIKRHEEHVFFFWCLSIASIVMMSFKFSAIGISRRFFRVNEMLR